METRCSRCGADVLADEGEGAAGVSSVGTGESEDLIQELDGKMREPWLWVCGYEGTWRGCCQ